MSRSKGIMMLLLAGCMLFTSCGQKNREQTQLPDELIAPQQANYDTVQVQPAEYVKDNQGDVEVVFPIQAELSWDTNNAHFREILVGRGDMVKEGDVLAVFEINGDTVKLAELELQLKRKKEQFKEDKITRQTAIAEAQAAAEEELIAQRIRIAELNVEKLQIAYEQFVYQTEREIAGQQEQIDELQELLNDNQLIAPFDGIIESVVSYNEGDRVIPGRTIISMYSTEEVLLNLDGADGKVRYNMDVTIESGRKNDRKSYSGRVISAPNILDNTISQNYAVVRLDQEVDADDLQQNTKYYVDTEVLQGILAVDKKAVHMDDKKSFVYILEDDTVKKRYVVKGPNNSEVAWILDGLSEGQSLILD